MDDLIFGYVEIFPQSSLESMSSNLNRNFKKADVIEAAGVKLEIPMIYKN